MAKSSKIFNVYFLYALALLALLPLPSLATLVKIDDVDVTYSNGWIQGNGCAQCAARPPTADIFESTWHDTTKNTADRKYFDYTFTGTSVAIYGILSDVQIAVANTNLTFEIDGKPQEPSFFHRSLNTSATAFQFNYQFFNASGLSNSSHIVHVELGPKSLFLFDYLIYEVPEGATNATVGSPTSKTISGGAIGGIAAGAVALIAIGLAAFFFFRRRNNGAKSGPEYGAVLGTTPGSGQMTSAYSHSPAQLHMSMANSQMASPPAYFPSGAEPGSLGGHVGNLGNYGNGGAGGFASQTIPPIIVGGISGPGAGNSMDSHHVNISSQAIANSTMNSKQRMLLEQQQQRSYQGHHLNHSQSQTFQESRSNDELLAPPQNQFAPGHGPSYDMESSGSGTHDTSSPVSMFSPVRVPGGPGVLGATGGLGAMWNSQNSLPQQSVTPYQLPQSRNQSQSHMHVRGPSYDNRDRDRDPSSINPSESGSPESAYGGMDAGAGAGMGESGNINGGRGGGGGGSRSGSGSAAGGRAASQRPTSLIFSDSGTAPPPYPVPQDPSAPRTPPEKQ